MLGSRAFFRSVDARLDQCELGHGRCNNDFQARKYSTGLTSRGHL